MHGDNDQLVPLGRSVILAKALIDASVEVTMKTLAGRATKMVSSIAQRASAWWDNSST
jgi:predicted esterase